MEYYSIIRKNEMMLFRNMDGLRDYHTKWGKPDREIPHDDRKTHDYDLFLYGSFFLDMLIYHYHAWLPSYSGTMENIFTLFFSITPYHLKFKRSNFIQACLFSLFSFLTCSCSIFFSFNYLKVLNFTLLFLVDNFNFLLVLIYLSLFELFQIKNDYLKFLYSLENSMFHFALLIHYFFIKLYAKLHKASAFISSGF